MQNLDDINKRIADRHDVFYWQAERRISEEEAASIFKDRHTAIKNDELIKMVNKSLVGDKCVAIDDFDPEKASFGNVNSCRVGHLESGKDVIIRCHPRGVKNGYFFVESLGAEMCIQNGLPSYHTYAIHQAENENDCAFQVIDKLPGITIDDYLKLHPEKEDELVYKTGQLMARVHQIEGIEGYGSFDNELASQGKLKGIYNSFYDSIVAGLEYDFKTLIEHKILTKEMADELRKLFYKDNPLLKCDKIVFVHNDFADWNLMTDGENITGIIDLDECVAGDPIRDIACWSTFFKTERSNKFLEGYFSIAKVPDNFEDRYRLLMLRQNISKMCLRVKRFSYNRNNEGFRLKIEKGKKDLKTGAEYFGIDTSINEM